MDESIEKFFRSIPVGRRSRPTERLWYPAADVLEARDGWIVKVELAGVRPDELSLTITGRELHISGIRRDATYSEGVTYYQMEITYSRFHRKISFPCDIRADFLEQHYNHGLLILRLKRSENCDDEKAISKSAGG